MKEERMMVLNMVNEGRITAEEAVNLLNALNKSNSETISATAKTFAKGVKEKTADIVEKAEPKVKKAAQDIAEMSVEVFGNIKDKIKEKTSQSEDETCDCSEYVDITDTVSDVADKTKEDEVVNACDIVDET